MKKLSFQEALAQVLEKDHRYAEEAYLFVREALDFTIQSLAKPKTGPERHVKGQELLEGIRTYALKEFGPIGKTVLNNWGIHRTEDFGEIVFNLVETGILGRTDEDRKEDFAGGYDFDAAFRKPFLPNEESTCQLAQGEENSRRDAEALRTTQKGFKQKATEGTEAE